VKPEPTSPLESSPQLARLPERPRPNVSSPCFFRPSTTGACLLAALVSSVSLVSFVPSAQARTRAGDLDLDSDDKLETDKPEPEPDGPILPTEKPKEAPRAPVPGLSSPRVEPYLARENQVAPGLVWLLTQAVPSPELLVGTEGARFGMRWQVTPLLYSFGMHRRLSPWRSVVVEPIARHAGSVEFFLSPEWIVYQGGTLLFDAGVRTTLPVLHRGEYLSVSLGVAHTRFDGHSAVRYEGGVYALFGILGVAVSVSPTKELAPFSTAFTLRVRYF
jgi:hypothetical protein